MKEPNLDPKLKIVAINYLKQGKQNAEKAVIDAGYSPRYARGHAYKIVARENVQEYIKWLETKEGDVTRHIYDLDDLREYWTEIMENPEVDIKHRLKASELLGRSIGAFEQQW